MIARPMMLAVGLLCLAAVSAQAASTTAPATAATTKAAPTTKAATAPEAAGTSCVIKGNVNSKGEKIYFDSHDSSYKRVVIDPAKGDRCFATVEAAKAAGFRAPKHG